MKYITPEQAKYYVSFPEGKDVDKADAFTLIESEDGWSKVYYYSNSLLDSSGNVMPLEYIYILVNKSVPNMVKIGMTTTTPDKRAKEISSHTGVAQPWEVIYTYKCYNSRLLEREIHSKLKNYRVNERREMFSVSVETAKEIIEELGYKYSTALCKDNGLDIQ